MDYRKSKFNSDELQEDTVANKNRKIFAYASGAPEVSNKNPFDDVLSNQKTTFREVSALDHIDKESTAVKPTFAYSGTDKGVNEKQWGSC